MLLLLTFLACDPDQPAADTGCRTEDDPAVTLHFDIETCAIIDYDCAESSECYQDACGCGCLLDEAP